MRVVCQRVSRAAVSVEAEPVAAIGHGLVLLVGVAEGDGPPEVASVVDKIAGLRVFPDAQGKMNLSIGDVEGALLVVSQFTLLADTRRGRRPSYAKAAPPEVAEPLIESMVEGFRNRGIPTSAGRFGSKMDVELVNDGPVTLVLDFPVGRMG